MSIYYVPSQFYKCVDWESLIILLVGFSGTWKQ